MNYFDLRAKRAAKMREQGFSLTALARHFGVSTMIIKNWLPPLRDQLRRDQSKGVPASTRHHCGYLKTNSRNDYEHEQRLAAHCQRIKRGE